MGKKTSKNHKNNKNHKKFHSSLDFSTFEGEDYENFLPTSPKKKNHVKITESANSIDKTSEARIQFRGKLRKLFFQENTIGMIKKQQIHVGEMTSNTELSPKEEYVAKDYTYIQMRLDIEKISSQFEKELEQFRLSDIEIRIAIQEDITILVKLYNRSFMRGSDPWSPATNAQFEELFSHENTVILIASTHGEEVGFIITDLEGENNEIGVICGLGTDPRWQRKGIARYLGVASWDYFRKLNVKVLNCEVYEGNLPSYKFIKSLHFEEYGTKIYQF